MRTVVLDAAGRLIHVGPWDYQVRAIEEPILVDGPPLDLLDEDGVKVGEQPTKVPLGRYDRDGALIGYQMRKVGEEVTNPLPDGAQTVERDVVETADGRLVLASDYAAQRRPAYPPLGDQLDALWKGGAEAEAMRAMILAVKAAYPKPGL